MGGPCSTNGEKWNAYRLLVGKPEGKRPLGRPRRRRVVNIRMDLGEVYVYIHNLRSDTCLLTFISFWKHSWKPFLDACQCSRR
jgi:hypothetical protein